MLCSCIDDSFTSYCVTELSPEQRATVQELDTQQRREQRTQPGVLDEEAAQRREQRAGVMFLLLAPCMKSCHRCLNLSTPLYVHV